MQGSSRRARSRRTLRSPRRCTAARRSRRTACRPRPRWPCTAACCRRRGRMPMPNLARAPRATPSLRWRSGRCSGTRTDSGPCCALDRLEALAEQRHSAASQSTGPSLPRLVAQQRRRRAVGRSERRQRLPAFGAGHAEVHGIVGSRREVHRLRRP